MPGPPPKRQTQRRRRNAPASQPNGTSEASTAAVVVRPAAGSWAHSLVQWYDSLADSGQATWYTATDWSSAWLMADAMNAELSADGVLKSATLAAWLKLNSSLLATEGDRRRAAIELTKPAAAEEGTDVSLLDEYRRKVDARRTV